MKESVQTALHECLKGMKPFSSTVQQVIKALAVKPVDMAAVSRAMELDPVLCAAVLRLANSAFYGFPRQVTQIREGCVLLGVHTLRQLMLSLSFIQAFPSDGGNGLNRGALWRHSIAVGVAARILAIEVGEEPERMFTAGLLHDIGKFILDQAFPAQYQQVYAYEEAHRVSCLDAEEQVLGATHTEVGSFALRQWRLPELYATVAQGHLCHNGSQLSKEVALVHIADVLVKGLQISPDNDRRMVALSPEAMAVVGIDLAEIEELLPQIDTISRDTVALLLN